MKHRKRIALIMAAILTASALSVTAFAADSNETETETSSEENSDSTSRSRHRHRDKVSEPEDAIGKDAAKETALTDARISAGDVGEVKARIIQTEDQTVVYRVSFTSGDSWYCYKIDAVTGEILDKTAEDAAAHEASKAERSDKEDKSSKTAKDGKPCKKHIGIS